MPLIKIYRVDVNWVKRINANRVFGSTQVSVGISSSSQGSLADSDHNVGTSSHETVDLTEENINDRQSIIRDERTRSFERVMTWLNQSSAEPSAGLTESSIVPYRNPNGEHITIELGHLNDTIQYDTNSKEIQVNISLHHQMVLLLRDQPAMEIKFPFPPSIQNN